MSTSHTLSVQAFLNVPSLRLMYLGSNRITQLEPFQFRHFETLEMLDLTENQLAIIPENAFSGMPRLSQLYLGQNIIEQIDSQAFLNNSLVILLLPNNRLVRVDENLFKGMGFLQQLSLKNNMVGLWCSPHSYTLFTDCVHRPKCLLRGACFGHARHVAQSPHR